MKNYTEAGKSVDRPANRHGWSAVSLPIEGRHDEDESGLIVPVVDLRSVWLMGIKISGLNREIFLEKPMQIKNKVLLLNGVLRHTGVKLDN